MKTKQSIQYNQGIHTGINLSNFSQNPSSNVRRNDDVSRGDSAQAEPTPDPKTSPDMPPGPARREYDDTGHEHEHKHPTAKPTRK